jgi:hypothetical protein
MRARIGRRRQRNQYLDEVNMSWDDTSLTIN